MLNAVLGANTHIQPEELSFYNRQLRNEKNILKFIFSITHKLFDMVCMLLF